MPHHHESTHSSFILLATSATGPHPFPSRTRSLSLSAPMVLRSRGRGRVGRRQLLNTKPAPTHRSGLLFFGSRLHGYRSTTAASRSMIACPPPSRDISVSFFWTSSAVIGASLVSNTQ